MVDIATMMILFDCGRTKAWSIIKAVRKKYHLSDLLTKSLPLSIVTKEFGITKEDVEFALEIQLKKVTAEDSDQE